MRSFLKAYLDRRRRPTNHHGYRVDRRSAKVLVVFAILLPAILGIVGVVVDGGLLTAHQRQLQNVADAAVAAAAMDVFQGMPDQQAEATVQEYVRRLNGLTGARIQMNHPPLEGRYASNPRYVELVVSRDAKTYLVHVLGGRSIRTIRARAVAGFENSSSRAAITVLSRTSKRQVAGLDVDAHGTVTIDGAILVNSENGAMDEFEAPAGRDAGPPYGVHSHGDVLVADNLRVAGGVDDPRQYRQANLQANQLPVEDPLQLRPPTVRSSGRGRHDFGGVKIPKDSRRPRRVSLEPGVYDWIQVKSGRVTFRPGIYIVQSVHPDTGVALDIQGGRVTANGVLFYIDGVSNSGRSTTPSVIMNIGARGQFTPLADASSSYDDLLLFQNPSDDRTIEINHQSNSRNRLSGIIYARQGHVNLQVRGTCQASFVVGTMRIDAVDGCHIQPVRSLPPSQDVFLVE